MKNFLRLAGAFVAALLILFAAKPAHALGPIDIEVGAKVGYATGTNTVTTFGAVNSLGVGIGGRAGISLFGFYGGFNLVDYLGGSDGVGDSSHALQVGGELGYNIKLSILTIRPQVGLGNITFSNSYANTSAIPSFNSGSFYVEPGVTALITIGILYFGVDGNALIITNGPASSLGAGTSLDTAFTLHGQIGLTF